MNGKKSPGRASGSDHQTTKTGGRAFGALLEISHANTEKRAPRAQAVQILAEYFEQWLAEDGHRTFDQVLGFASPGKGKAPFIETLRGRTRDLFVAHLVAVLHASGIGVKEAHEHVAAAVNKSKDSRFRKQCRELGITTYQPETVRKIFDGLGGARWARFAGYFGDCEERRTLAKLKAQPQDLNDPECQANIGFLNDLIICAAFPFRTASEVMALK